MRYIVLIFLLTSQLTYSQIIIEMKRMNGVSVVPCKINGILLQFVFDTGAGDVSISATEAKLMLEKGLLNSNDILGMANYIDANGDISEGVVINLKEVEIGGIILNNVRASVLRNLNAPLLFGQSAISKLGKIQLDLEANKLTILNPQNSYRNSSYALKEDYKKAQIGNDVWMLESLNVKKYRDGSLIPEAKSTAEWISYGKRKIGCWMVSKANKGKIYNGFAVKDSRGLAPEGWHIPTETEWKSLAKAYESEYNQLYQMEGAGVCTQFGEQKGNGHFFWADLENTSSTMSGYGINKFEVRSFGWLKECGLSVVCIKD